MERIRQLLPLAALASLAIMATLTALAGRLHPRQTPEKMTSAMFADNVMRVRALNILTNQLPASARNVSVTASNGTINLTGSVRSWSEWEKAAALVQSIQSIKQVKNDLQVEP